MTFFYWFFLHLHFGLRVADFTLIFAILRKVTFHTLQVKTNQHEIHALMCTTQVERRHKICQAAIRKSQTRIANFWRYESPHNDAAECRKHFGSLVCRFACILLRLGAVLHTHTPTSTAVYVRVRVRVCVCVCVCVQDSTCMGGPTDP